MKLTEKNKQIIDSLSYENLLSRWRFAPLGDPWFADETGKYWAERMKQLRERPNGNELHVEASKNIGWEK